MNDQTTKSMTYVEHTDSIVIGYEIGSADTAHGRLGIVAAGKTVRFSLDGVDGYVDLDLTEFATDALKWLGERKNEMWKTIGEALAPAKPE
jgi:hypothetical protein